MNSLLVSNKKPELFASGGNLAMTFEERSAQLEEEKLSELERAKRDKNSPFKRWTQVNNEHTKELMWLTLKYPKANAILLFLVDNMDEYNAVMCSYKVLEEALNISSATVQRNVKVLKENGFVAILKSGTNNIYTINDNIYWKSWGNNKKYSKFPASIILSLSEQDEDTQKKAMETMKHKEITIKE